MLYVDRAVALEVDAQNDPLGAGPVDWAGLPPGRYDVAALRIGVVDTGGNADHLFLGRGSVGAACVVGGSADLAGVCAGY